jgi:putative two-component system response regulator
MDEIPEPVSALKGSDSHLPVIIYDLVHAMGAVVEARNTWKRNHHRRVSQLASAIAKEIGLPEETVDALGIAGAVHDIGEVVVPEDILLKPMRLSHIDFLMLKPHPQVAHDIVKAIRFPWDIAGIVLSHHERLDGSGYPSGLKGEQIPREAQILAVADVVEAMMSNRSYRSAFPVETVLKEVSEGSNTLYSAEAVSAALRLFREKGFSFL